MKSKSVVIIGAGLAGVTIANELKDKFNVTVLEKGGHSITLPHTTFLKRKFASSKTYCFGHGGTSNLWHNGLIDIPINDVGEEFRKILLSSKGLTNKAAKSLNFIGDYEDDKRKSLQEIKNLLTNDVLNIDNILIPKSSPPLKVDVGVNLETSTTDIKYEYKGNRIVKVNFSDGQENKAIDVDILIISGGGIGSPSIISNIYSSIGRSECNNIGQGLIDHPMGFIGKIKVKRKYKKMFSVLCHKDYFNYTSRTGVVVKENSNNHIFYFRPAISMNNSNLLYKFKSKLGTSTWKERIKLVFNYRFYHPDIIQEILAHLFNIRINTRNFAVWAVFEQQKSDNFVGTKINSDDVVSWSISQAEIESYKSAIQIFLKKIEPYIEDSIFVKNELSDYLWSAAHHSGTCPLGGKNTVLDNNLKLDGFENVYVCDGSVIPEHSYANTGLTISKLALRLCSLLKKGA